MKKINLDIQKFANPDSISGQTTYWKAEAKFTDAPGTSANNASNFIANINLYLLKSATTAGNATISCTISGEGITTVSESFTKSVAGWKTVGAAISLGKIEVPQIPHNGNGTKTIHVKLQMILSDNTSLIPALTGNIVVDQDITLERIYRYSTLLAVENFDEDSDYTALDYVSYSGSGASDTLSVRATNVSGELVLDDSSWTDDQINLTNKTQYTQIQSIREYLSQYLSGVDSVQATFTLISTIGDKSLTTTAIVYMNKKYVFSQYKVTQDIYFKYDKKYFLLSGTTYNSLSLEDEDIYGVTSDNTFDEDKRYFKNEGDAGYALLVEGQDYTNGQQVSTIGYTVYEENKSIAAYKTAHGISNPIYEKDDNYNICQHILHNRTEGKYRMAINGVADPTGPPLQVYDGYSSTQKEDLFFYRPGDTVSLNNYSVGGMISSSQQEIRFSLALPKRLDYVKLPSDTSNTTSFKVVIRHKDGGYIIASNADGGIQRKNFTTLSMVKAPSSGPCNNIRFAMIKGGTATWNKAGTSTAVTNNTPLSVEVIKLELKFL